MSTALIGSATAMLLVFHLDSGCYAIDAALVGEVATIDEPTPLPRCHPAVFGLANLRGQALAIVDLAQVLGIDGPTPGMPPAGSRVLVLRLPKQSAGAVVTRVEGVYPRDPAGFRAANRNAEAAWIAGFHAIPLRQGRQPEPEAPAGGRSPPGELLATVIAADELGLRLSALAFLRPASRAI